MIFVNAIRLSSCQVTVSKPFQLVIQQVPVQRYLSKGVARLLQKSISSSLYCYVALLQVFKLSRNPYMWHSSAKQVNSDVVGISIYREDGETVRLKNLTQPFSISLPRKRGQSANYYVVSFEINNSYSHSQVHATFPGSCLMATFATLIVTAQLNINMLAILKK